MSQQETALTANNIMMPLPNAVAVANVGLTATPHHRRAVWAAAVLSASAGRYFNLTQLQSSFFTKTAREMIARAFFFSGKHGRKLWWACVGRVLSLQHMATGRYCFDLSALEYQQQDDFHPVYHSDSGVFSRVECQQCLRGKPVGCGPAALG